MPLLLLLLLLLLLVQVTWEGPESVRVNCGDYIPLVEVPDKVRLQQRSTSTNKLMTFTYYGILRLSLDLAYKREQ